MINKFNKKGQIASTITWVVAFLIIFFMIILFLAFTGLMAGQRQIPVLSFFYGAPDEINLEKYTAESLEVQQGLVRFLNTQTDFSGEKLKIKHLVFKDEAGINKLNEEAKLFVNEGIAAGKYERASIVLLSAEEKSSCILEEVTSEIFISSNKKIVLCVKLK